MATEEKKDAEERRVSGDESEDESEVGVMLFKLLSWDRVHM